MKPTLLALYQRIRSARRSALAQIFGPPEECDQSLTVRIANDAFPRMVALEHLLGIEAPYAPGRGDAREAFGTAVDADSACAGSDPRSCVPPDSRCAPPRPSHTCASAPACCLSVSAVLGESEPCGVEA